ncbi:MAG TPA: hypothetical protein VJV74_00200 [Terriglobia bacterium]|nr:hypothetical protein [Terriglobia bacterium]
MRLSRFAGLLPALLLVSWLAMFAQQGGPQERPTLGKPAPDEKPPTLGKGTTPEGPKTSTTSDPRRLMSIKTIYVDSNIENALGEKLAEGISKMGRFRIVAERKEADAVMSGTCFDSRRLKTVHSEVSLNDRASGHSIWQDVVRRHYNPPPLSKAVDETATILVGHLTESIQEAERR